MKSGGRSSIFDDPAELARMFKRYKKGETMSAIGRSYGVDHSTIYHHLKKHGVHEKGRAYPRIPARAIEKKVDRRLAGLNDPATSAEIVLRYQQGQTPDMLAILYGFSNNGIRNHLKKLGIYQPRRRGDHARKPIFAKPKSYADYVTAAAHHCMKKHGRNYSYRMPSQETFHIIADTPHSSDYFNSPPPPGVELASASDAENPLIL